MAAKIEQAPTGGARGILSDNGLLEVRESPLQGLGVFALKRIRKGTRIIEYLGERITPAEADARYERLKNPNHTFLFTIDDRLVVDATWKGNVARYINHSCAPNCESVIDRRRIWIEALRDIEAGEELTYDYHLDLPDPLPKGWRDLYGCRCGAETCRGTLLAPRERATNGRGNGRRSDRGSGR